MPDDSNPEPKPEPNPEPVASVEPAGEPRTGASRAGLLAIGAGVLVVLLVAALLITRRSDDRPVAATPATFAPTSGGSSIPAELPLTDGTQPVDTAPIETFPPDVTAPPNTHTLPPQPFQVVEPKAPGNLAIFPAVGAAAPSQTLPNPILVNGDPKAPVPLTLLLRGNAGNGWLEVFLPIRPNGSTGFVKAADVKLTPHDFHIEIRLSQYTLKVFQGTKVILDTKVAVASNNTPTPGGLYYTNMLLQPPDPKAGYGTYAYGLSGFSDVLKSFNGGPGQLGIHGGGDNSTIGRNVSHGCIRMFNSDIEKLVPILPLGVPVQIIA